MQIFVRENIKTKGGEKGNGKKLEYMKRKKNIGEIKRENNQRKNMKIKK